MTPDAEHWEQLQELFHLAEITPPEDLDRVLAQACPDEALRSRALSIHRASTAEVEQDAPRASLCSAGAWAPTPSSGISARVESALSISPNA